MTDLELLKLAAKAAGLTKLTRWSENITDWDSRHHGGAALYSQGTGGQCNSWNPLTDDGDALRLAVKLGIYFAAMDNSAIASKDAPSVYEQVRFDDIDKYAATRRAIVRVAAQIGAAR